MLNKTIKVILISIATIFLAYHIYFNFSYCGVAPFGCPSYSSTIDHNHQIIATGSGPEDFALDKLSKQKRLIISCSPRRGEEGNGSFYSVDIGSSISKKLHIIPENIKIHPHGIHIATVDSIQWLYTISHDTYEGEQIDRILRFEIAGDTLIQDERFELTDPLLKIPNDLHVLPDGTIYATNYLKSQDFSASLLTAWGKRTGDIVFYDGNTWSIAIDDLCYPNGIWIDENNTSLVMANGACQEISRYDIVDGYVDVNSKQSTRSHDIKIPMGDNLMMDDQGRIWTANHPCPLNFLGHAGDPNKKSAIEIRVIDPNTLKSNIVIAHDGSILSAASTALYVDGHLYISQVFDPFIIDIKAEF